MIKIHKCDVLKNIVSIAGIIAFGVIIIVYPQIAGNGVKSGLKLLGEKLIPSLFPFMVVAEYISLCPVTAFFIKHLEKPAEKIFRTRAVSFLCFILGCMGGYPIGAKAISQFRKNGLITAQECTKLFMWCINPGAAFVITAVGTFMLKNTLSGVIMYISCILSSATLGVFSGFFCKRTPFPETTIPPSRQNGHIFIKSVSGSVDSMLAICGWVIFFSTFCELCNTLITNDQLRLFINAVSEVTLGCDNTIQAGLPLPVICAVISFGGLAVAAQISPHLAVCGVKLSTYICWRVAGGALSAFYCSQILRFFPRCSVVNATLTPVHTLTEGVPTALVMILMCIVLIFEVDNKRKVW